MRGGKDERVDVIVESNPYANMESGADGRAAAAVSDLRYQQDEISMYELPKHTGRIEYFKVMLHDIYECEKRYLPNIIMTVTSKNEVYVWYENLLSVSNFMPNQYLV